MKQLISVHWDQILAVEFSVSHYSYLNIHQKIKHYCDMEYVTMVYKHMFIHKYL